MSLSPRRRPHYATVSSNLSFTPAKELVPGDPDYNIGDDWPAYFTKHLNHPHQHQQPVQNNTTNTNNVQYHTDKKRTKKQRRKEKKRHSAPTRVAPYRPDTPNPLLWVQLVMGDQPVGQPAELDASTLDHVHGLKKAIKEEYAVELEQVSAARLQVFFDATPQDGNNGQHQHQHPHNSTTSKPLAANAPLPQRATYDHPIMVVAPATTTTTSTISLASTSVAATTQPKATPPLPTAPPPISKNNTIVQPDQKQQATTAAASKKKYKKDKDVKKTTAESKAKAPNNNNNNNNNQHQNSDSKRRDDIIAKAAKLAASSASTENKANNKRDQIKAKGALLAKDASGKKAPSTAATAATIEKKANNDKRDQIIKAKGAALAKETNGMKTHAAAASTTTTTENNNSSRQANERRAKALALLEELAAESNPSTSSKVEATSVAPKTNIVNSAKKRDEKIKTKAADSSATSLQNKTSKKTSSNSNKKRDQIIAKAAALAAAGETYDRREQIKAAAAALAAQSSSSSNNNTEQVKAKAVPVPDPAAAAPTKPKKKKKPQQKEPKDVPPKPITDTTTASTTKTTDTTTLAASASVKNDKRVRVQGKVVIALASEFVTLGYKNIGSHEAMGLRNADTKRTCIFCRRKVTYECTHEICQQRKVEHMGKSFWGIPICPHARGPRKDLKEFGLEANTKTCLELHVEQLQLAYENVKAEKEAPAPLATTNEEPVVNHKKRGRPIGSTNNNEENGDKSNKTKKRKTNAATELAAMMVATGAGDIGVHQIMTCRNLLNEKHSERHCLVCGRRIRTECSHDICQARNVVNNQGKETHGAPICDPQKGPRTHMKQYGLEANTKTCLQLHIEELEKEFDAIKATQLAEPFAM